VAAKKQKNNSINLLKGITGSRLARIIAVIAIVLTIPVTVLMSQNQQNTQQEAATTSLGSCGYKNAGKCQYTYQSCTSPNTFYYNMCPAYGTNVQCCYPTNTDPPPIIKEIRASLKSRSGSTCMIELYAKAEDPGSTKLEIAFRYRHENICASAKTTNWISSPWTDIGNTEEFRTTVSTTCGYKYFFSAKARGTTIYYSIPPDGKPVNVTKYSNGPLFCGSYGWADNKSFIN